MATPASAAKKACSPTRWLLVVIVSLVADMVTAMPSASKIADIISAVISAMPRSPSDWSLQLLVINHLFRSENTYFDLTLLLFVRFRLRGAISNFCVTRL